MSLTPEQLVVAMKALRRAVEALGGQQKTAKFVGVTQGAVSKRLAAGKPIWGDGDVVIRVEAATGISRHDLRPDIYPRDEAPLHEAPASGRAASPATAPAGGAVFSPLPGLRP